MRKCTLEELGCEYALARQIAESQTQAILADGKSTLEHKQIAMERLQVMRMMDEMYGVRGDKEGDTLAYSRKASVFSASPPKSEVLEEMAQLKETLSAILSGISLERISGAEKTILMKKVTAGLVNGGRRVFTVSDSAGEEEITKWLEHPEMDGSKLITNTMVMNIAAQTPIPTHMMESILRRLFQSDYERLYSLAEKQIRQRLK